MVGSGCCVVDAWYPTYSACGSRTRGRRALPLRARHQPAASVERHRQRWCGLHPKHHPKYHQHRRPVCRSVASVASVVSVVHAVRRQPRALPCLPAPLLLLALLHALLARPTSRSRDSSLRFRTARRQCRQSVPAVSTLKARRVDAGNGSWRSTTVPCGWRLRTECRSRASPTTHNWGS